MNSQLTLILEPPTKCLDVLWHQQEVLLNYNNSLFKWVQTERNMIEELTKSIVILIDENANDYYREYAQHVCLVISRLFEDKFETIKQSASYFLKTYLREMSESDVSKYYSNIEMYVNDQFEENMADDIVSIYQHVLNNVSLDFIKTAVNIKKKWIKTYFMGRSGLNKRQIVIDILDEIFKFQKHVFVPENILDGNWETKEMKADVSKILMAMCDVKNSPLEEINKDQIFYENMLYMIENMREFNGNKYSEHYEKCMLAKLLTIEDEICEHL
eukprot:330001_1